ncbi:MAG: RDD family protein [Clostridiales bacterium]|jgi:uncharacterized RDD family membrane protein YckC|nr:RDD family protein [Eubacteriales bacterium]MDH7565380.1 RDD family protein [Clostridiales bacterium]
MRKILEIPTPENVHVDYELAGLGSRFVALIIDHLVQIGMLLLVLMAMLMGGVDFKNAGEYNSVVVALGIILAFVVLSGYFIFFEMIMNGQTPGKKVMKLRVIKQNGEPVSFFDSFLRNILRIVDMLPSLYLVGACFIVFTKYYKRVGDFAGNTVVVKVRKEEKPAGLDTLLSKTPYGGEGAAVPNVYPVNDFEYGILKEFLARKDGLGERKPVFAYHLNRYFMWKFAMEKPAEDPYAFFEDILRMNSGM